MWRGMRRDRRARLESCYAMVRLGSDPELIRLPEMW